MTVYILLRYIGHVGEWAHSSFNRLFTVLRGVMWSYIDMWELLQHPYQFDWEAGQIRHGCLDWVMNDEDEFEAGYY